MLDTSKKHDTITTNTNKSGWKSIDKKGNPIKKSPFAGVGNPKKYDLAGSVLNLAKRTIEKGIIRKEKNGNNSYSVDMFWKKS